SVIKRATHVANSDRYSPFSLAELSSGLATVEFLDGRRKRSKDLFRKALIRPNDNALAQVEWALSRDNLFQLSVRGFDVKRNFEALALEAFNNGRWKEAVECCESWFMDMPFAKRPLMLG